MTPTVPRFAELAASADWRTVDFISDLHLHEAEPQTFAAWQSYMARTPADAVFILGDMFEVWVGDDAALPGSFEARCVDVLRAAGSHAKLFFMHGNRDFLAGAGLMAQCQATLLDDPTVLGFAGQRFLLTHGDALCLDDVDYMRFRQEVRSTAWQQEFLAKPLAQRQAIARGLREQSEARKRTGVHYADVDTPSATQWLHAANAATMIHGHTHKPADHDLANGLRRIVLSDWDAAAAPPRAQVLRLTAGGLQRLPARAC
ncbi:MAG TPA: UDP-2,3-diacylglucosamine diphosphatase [Burkholderiaceae bacterium]|nr:UDP-2,3-diacylglucosamine diphosphatase [Burkholderiaceae bacterium]